MIRVNCVIFTIINCVVFLGIYCVCACVCVLISIIGYILLAREAERLKKKLNQSFLRTQEEQQAVIILCCVLTVSPWLPTGTFDSRFIGTNWGK